VENEKLLSTKKGYVLIYEYFKIVTMDEKKCVLSFVHPINYFTPSKRIIPLDIKLREIALSKDKWYNLNLAVNEPIIKIEIICNNKYMKPLASTIFELNKKVRIICFGQIVGWNNNSLEIIPIAIY
jgi:hypothetical protein